MAHMHRHVCMLGEIRTKDLVTKSRLVAPQTGLPRGTWGLGAKSNL